MSDAMRRVVAFSLAIGVFALDRGSKWLVETHLNGYDVRTVIPGLLNIVRSGNTGIAFGIFNDPQTHSRLPLLIGISLVGVALLAGLLWRIERLDGPSAIGLSLIFGGAMGNVFDRVRAGSVTDFFDFHAGNHHWYTFNVGDASIWTGAGLLILGMLKSRHGNEVRA
jgi:signal peptidase II